MESITIKVEDNLAKEINSAMKKFYSTKTEFIREAIRDKLNEINREELIKTFLKYKGKSKIKTTLKDNLKTKEFVSKELIAELDRKFS